MKKPVIVALCCLLALSTGTAAFARGYSFFFDPPSLPSSFEESLNSLTPRPRPRISSGIFLPPNRSNTTNRISINSVGPRNRGRMNNVMVCSGLWCVRFPSGLSCRIPGDRDCLADKCTKNFRNPAFRGEKKRGAPEAPRPNCLSGICYLKNIDEISL